MILSKKKNNQKISISLIDIKFSKLREKYIECKQGWQQKNITDPQPGINPPKKIIFLFFFKAKIKYKTCSYYQIIFIYFKITFLVI